MKNKNVWNFISALLFVASIIFNYYLFARAKTAEQSNADYLKINEDLNRDWQKRLDSSFHVTDSLIKITSKKITNTTKRIDNDKKEIKHTDSIVRNISVDKLDSLWKLTGIE